MLLRRALTRNDRELLAKRRLELEPWFIASSGSERGELINQMFLGFKEREKDETTVAAELSQYSMALAGFPLWAVHRACNRFSRCEVRDEELGKGQTWSRTFGPSQAHLAIVTRELVRPFGEEFTRIKRAQSAPIPVTRARAPGDAEKIRESAERFLGPRREFDKKNIGEAARAVLEREKGKAEEAIANEYRNAGLEPPLSRPDRIMPTLGLMLQAGCTIEDHPDGGKVLIKPPIGERL